MQPTQKQKRPGNTADATDEGPISADPLEPDLNDATRHGWAKVRAAHLRDQFASLVVTQPQWRVMQGVTGTVRTGLELTRLTGGLRVQERVDPSGITTLIHGTAIRLASFYNVLRNWVRLRGGRWVAPLITIHHQELHLPEQFQGVLEE